MNIWNVLKLLKKRGYAARRSWPNLTYVFLDGEILMYSSMGIDTVWTPAHADLLKTDWYEIIPER